MPLVAPEEANVAVLTTCKGRLSHLQRALPTWLAQETTIRYSITVLDYACPEGTYAWLVEQADPRITAAKYETDSPYYAHAHARNLVARAANAEILVFLDADNLLRPGWLSSACAQILLGDADYCESLWHPQCRNPGTCAITATHHHRIRGFDESLRNWGASDKDYYLRASVQGRKCQWDVTLLEAIPHDEAARVRHYQVKSTQESNRLNETQIQDWRRRVNPNGYGLGELRLRPGHSG